MGLGRLISQHTEEIKSQFVCAFIHACIYHYMRNLTQNLVATFYSQFYLVSYHTQKPHLDNFNLYHPVKMSSPTFSATILFSMTSPRVYVVLRPPASQMPQHPRNIYCPTIN